jgi:putative ABC transport system ATP-binding protein
VSPTEPIVRCEAVVRIYTAASGPVSALKEIDVDVDAGAITAFVGPSGSGKSTLLRLVAAADRPTAGEVTIDGVPTRALPERRLRQLRRRRIAYVHQRPSHNLLTHLTVRQHLVHAARLAGRRTAPVDDTLDALGLADHAAREPTTLSGGEQQRLAVAQATIRDPALLVADEPTAELDLAAATDLLRVLADLRDRGTSVVISTHDPAVMAVADHTIELRDGSLHTTTHASGSFAVIDRAGRIQLPPDALARFPTRRATIHLADDGSVRLDPP